MKRRILFSIFGILMVGSCSPIVKSVSTSVPAGIEISVSPHIRIGLVQGITRPRFSATGGIRVIDPALGEVASHGESTEVEVRARNKLVTVGNLALAMIILAPVDPAGGVVFNGRTYGGTIEVRPGGDGVTVVNRITLEEYLVGVVAAEIGRRRPDEQAALEAQAVASRTYALRNMKPDSRLGFDLVATTSNQVYRGMPEVQPLAAEAVRRTRGEVLTWNGEPIDAFYSSTCGGRSEAGGDVFVSGTRPYLTSRADVDPNGVAWCAISPRFQWRESWNAAEIAASLSRSLAIEGLTNARVRDLTDIQVANRTESGRVSALELMGVNGSTILRGSEVRRVLSPPGGGLLRSTDFVLRISRAGGRIDRIVAEGRGFGHGVGMCQWGAIGRARAGQDYRTILMSYFPGTTLERMY